MKQYRIEQLADGIFAIVMTLLVFEIRIPEIILPTTNQLLFEALKDLYPLFLSYVVSFSLLFTYWRAHHAIITDYAKSIDTSVINYNALFFFFVALVPFTSHFLGTYYDYQAAIIVFATNVIAIGMTLYFMRNHIHLSKNVVNVVLPPDEEARAQMRIVFPVLCALVSTIICFFSIPLALIFFMLGILFNLSKGSTHVLVKVLPIVTSKSHTTE